MTVEFLDAVKSGDAARARELLASDRALARERDDEGATALHHAAEGGHREIVILLLEAGADVNARDDRFHATPAGWAIEYLRMRGGLLAMEIEDLLLAIRERDLRWVRRVVTRLPALAGATDRSGKPLAHYANECGDEEIARLFRQQPASARASPGEPHGVVMDSRAWRPLAGSVVFLVLVPGTVAGWVPFWLSRWQMRPPFLGSPALRVMGAVLVLVGVGSLLESILRFALVGLGTPAPVAPPTRLVVSGQYRHVRNPMYVAVVAAVLGQALLLGSIELLRYAAVLWVGFEAFVLLYEEPALRARFGSSYDAYRRNVRRWWPRLRPWKG